MFLTVSLPRKSKIVSHIPAFPRADTSPLTPRLPVAPSTFKKKKKKNPSQLCLFHDSVSSLSPSSKAESLCKHPSGGEIHPKQIMTDKHNLPFSLFNLFTPSDLFPASSQSRPGTIPSTSPRSAAQHSTTQHANTHAKIAFPPCATKPRGSSIHI